MVARVFGLGVAGLIAIALLIALLVGMAAGCKEYTRYQKREDSKNALKRAEYTKKIKIEEAKAARDSAVFLAEAETQRARGVAQANKIIAGSITEQYLRYFYIQSLSDLERKGGSVIYVPTEAGLPILEAGKR